MVKKIVIHILLVVSMVIISIPVWNNVIDNNQFALADSFSDIPISINNSISSYSRENGYIVKNNKLILRNQNTFNKNYTLIYRVPKNDLFEFEDTFIMINNEKKHVLEYHYEIDENNYYIYLAEGNINKYTTIEYDFNIYYKNYKVSNLSSSFIIK